MAVLDPNCLEAVLKSYRVPCHPQVLTILEKEFTRPKPDLDVIALLINSDLSFSAAVIQIANSKLFKTRYKINKLFISTIDAVHFVGIDRIKKIMVKLLERDQVDKNDTNILTRFWDTSLNVAAVSAHLAQRLICATPDESFLLGFFRDCAVPYMMKNFPGYNEFFNQYSTDSSFKLTMMENEKFKTNHQVIGYCLAREWNLPEVICRSILGQHMIDPPSKELSNIVTHKNVLVSLVYIAELISFRYRGYKIPISDEQENWPTIDKNILGHLDIAQLDLHEMMQDTLEKMTGIIADYKP